MIQFLATALVVLCTFMQSGHNRSPGALQRAQPVPPAMSTQGLRFKTYDVGNHTGHAKLQLLLDSLIGTAKPLPVSLAFERFEELERMRRQVDSTTEGLLTSLRGMIEPPLELDGRPVGHLGHVKHGLIGLVGSDEQHAWLDSFLHTAAEWNGRIQIQTKVFVLDSGVLTDLLPKGNGSILEAAELKQALAKLTDASAELLSHTSMTMSPFQEGVLSSLNQHSYVQDYEFKVVPGLAEELLDPILATVDEGVSMGARGIPLANGKLQIHANLSYSTLKQPIRTAQVSIGLLAKQVTLQLPEVSTIALKGQFDLGPGQTLFLTTAAQDGEQDVFAFVSASRVPAMQQDVHQHR